MAHRDDSRAPLADPTHPVPCHLAERTPKALARRGRVLPWIGLAVAFVSLAATGSTARADWIDITPNSLTVSPMQIGFDTTDPDRIFVGSYGDGLFRSENCGETWNRNYTDFFEGEGIATILVNDVELNPGDPTQGIAITLSGSYFTDDSGLSWHRHPDNNVGDGPAIGYDLVAIPDGSGLVASEVGDPFIGGAPWVYLWATDSWTPANPMFLNVAGESTLGIGFDAGDPSVLYIGNTFRNFWTDDLGTTLNNNSAGLSDNNTRVVVGDPEIPGQALCGVDGGLFRQTTPGGGWTAYGAGLTGPIWALIHDPDVPDVMFAGTDDGVFQSDDRGASWTIMDLTGLPLTKVMDLGIHPGKSNILYATFSDGTPSGGGVFYLELDVTTSTPLASLPTSAALRVSPNPGSDQFLIAWSPLATSDAVTGPRSGRSEVQIFDAVGRRVAALRPSNAYTAVWNGRDDSGQAVPTGTYFVRMVSREGGGTVLTQSIRVIR